MATQQNSLEKYIVKKVITCYASHTIVYACSLMAKHNIGTIVIVDKDNTKKAIGIFTEQDLVRKVISSNVAVIETLDRVMSKKLITASADSTDTQISHLMTKHKVKKIVILKNDKLYGIITQTDMMKVLAQKWL